MELDLKTIISLSKDKSKRKELGRDNIDIKASMYPFIKNYTSYIETLSTYELSAIIIDKRNWIASRNFKQNTWIYKPGEIVMVYLGSSNYGNELSYYHPAIIFYNLYSSVLIIPCSSTINNGKYEVIGERADGFQNKTSIQLDKIRIIDKKRILRNKVGGVVGNVVPSKMKEIQEKVLITYLKEYDVKIKELEEKKLTLERENEELKKQNDLLKKELENVKKV